MNILSRTTLLGSLLPGAALPVQAEDFLVAHGVHSAALPDYCPLFCIDSSSLE